MAYELVIRAYKDPDYRHVIAKRDTARELERTDDGANRNLNHDDYYTAIEEVA